MATAAASLVDVLADVLASFSRDVVGIVAAYFHYGIATPGAIPERLFQVPYRMFNCTPDFCLVCVRQK